MLGSAKLVAFAATANADAAAAFYTKTLGLDIVADTPFALVLDANGTTLRIQKVESVNPAGHTLLGWEVADITAAVDSLVNQGVTFERYSGMPQDDRGIWSTPDGARVAWFKDPDGHTLSLSQAPA